MIDRRVISRRQSVNPVVAGRTDGRGQFVPHLASQIFEKSAQARRRGSSPSVSNDTFQRIFCHFFGFSEKKWHEKGVYFREVSQAELMVMSGGDV